jgi:hypothetical protein
VAQLCNRYTTRRAQCRCLRASVCECASCRWQLRAGKIAHSTSYSTSKQDHCMLHAQVPLHTHTHALAHPVSSPKLYLILCVWVCMRVLGSQQIKSRGPFTTHTHTHTHTHTRTHTRTHTHIHTHAYLPPSDSWPRGVLRLSPTVSLFSFFFLQCHASSHIQAMGDG